eukprot:CAMPEP_0202864508 /NCGR_PEP_ID=MMETSP1391-20130828/4721_1 /ASSEMBLY_ACC=CAM_ASM_000867 /TAXON_ID=1034604 /ORGANISM="Chlamydomonas leiostraca, Strain SAG 11-49" /LENGTH=739 /DNA_ID=CAMNT_0049544255 /DNA_START=99 /DNA_END=2318 /DNA_ORIENTATION=-
MDQYVQQREIGKGAYGVAYIVQSKVDGTRHVLKKVRLARQSFKERSASLRELQLMASMQHRNVLAFREAWVESGCVVCIVVELCESGDLATQLKLRVNNQQMFLEEHLHEMAVQLAGALEYIHKNQIAHRDIKSSNIFITGSGCLKLADFGLAVVLDAKTPVSRTMVGTPGYMAPQLMQSDVEYNPPSNDMWGLGCVLYELSALKPAFTAFNMQGLVKKVTSGAPLPLPNHFSEEWKALIRALLAKDESKRPTAQEVLALPWLQAAIARVEKRFGPALPGGADEYILLRELPSGIQALAAQFKEQEDSATRKAAEEKARQKELRAKYAPKGLLQKQAQEELAKAAAELNKAKAPVAAGAAGAGGVRDASPAAAAKPTASPATRAAARPVPAPGPNTKGTAYAGRAAAPARAARASEVAELRKPAAGRAAGLCKSGAGAGSAEVTPRPGSAPASPTRQAARASVEALPAGDGCSSSSSGGSPPRAEGLGMNRLSLDAQTIQPPSSQPQPQATRSIPAPHVIHSASQPALSKSPSAGVGTTQPKLSKAVSAGTSSGSKAAPGALAQAIAAQLAPPPNTASLPPGPAGPTPAVHVLPRASSTNTQQVQGGAVAGGITSLPVPRPGGLLRTNPHIPTDHPGMAAAKGLPPLAAVRTSPDHGAGQQAGKGAPARGLSGNGVGGGASPGPVYSSSPGGTGAAVANALSDFMQRRRTSQEMGASAGEAGAVSSPTVDAVSRMLYQN